MLYLWLCRVVNDPRLGPDFFRPAITLAEVGPLEWVTENGGPASAIAVGLADLTTDQVTALSSDAGIVLVPLADRASALPPAARPRLNALVPATEAAGVGETFEAVFDRLASRIGNKSIDRLRAGIRRNYPV